MVEAFNQSVVAEQIATTMRLRHLHRRKEVARGVVGFRIGKCPDI
jgi:hypothetical protein